MMLRLKKAGIITKKCVLYNEIPRVTKQIIRDKYHMEIKLVLSGCHRRNTIEVKTLELQSPLLSVFVGSSSTINWYIRHN